METYFVKSVATLFSERARGSSARGRRVCTGARLVWPGD